MNVYNYKVHHNFNFSIDYTKYHICKNIKNKLKKKYIYIIRLLVLHWHLILYQVKLCGQLQIAKDPDKYTSHRLLL